MARYIDRNPVPTGLSDASTRRSHHDVVVVGARCAGAAAARLLARAGHDVVMVDRSHPARDTSSTHSLSRGGVVQLHRWGLLDDVVATGAPEIRSVPSTTTARASGTRSRTGPGSTSSSRRAATCSTPCWPTPPWPPAPACHGTDGDRRAARRRRPGDRGDRARRRRHRASSCGRAGRRRRRAPLVGGAVRRRAGRRAARPHRRVLLHVRRRRRLGRHTSSTSSDDAFAGVFPTHHGEACVWLIRPADELARGDAAPGPTGPPPGWRRCDRTVPELARTAERAGSPPRCGARRAAQPPAPAVGPGLGPGRRRRLPPRPDHRARHHRRLPRRRAARRRARHRAARPGLRRARALAGYQRRRDLALREIVRPHRRAVCLPRRRAVRRAAEAARRRPGRARRSTSLDRPADARDTARRIA